MSLGDEKKRAYASENPDFPPTVTATNHGASKFDCW